MFIYSACFHMGWVSAYRFVAVLNYCQNLIPDELSCALHHHVGTARPFPGHGVSGVPPTTQFCPELQTHFKDFELWSQARQHCGPRKHGHLLCLA